MKKKKYNYIAEFLISANNSVIDKRYLKIFTKRSGYGNSMRVVGFATILGAVV